MVIDLLLGSFSLILYQFLRVLPIHSFTFTSSFSGNIDVIDGVLPLDAVFSMNAKAFVYIFIPAIIFPLSSIKVICGDTIPPIKF